MKLFSPRGSLTLVSIHGETHMNTYQGGRNRPRKESLDYVCVILSSKILKLYVSQTKKCLNSWSSHQKCSIEKAVLKNVAKFTRKNLCWSLLLIDLLASKPATFLRRDSNTSVFLWILQSFKNTYFDENL